jgi:sodium-dependent phosphate transporter
MAVAGFGVFLGVTTFGYHVIRTIGKELTEINYQRGFCIEFASTLTVVVATVLEMPVSTTHCQGTHYARSSRPRVSHLHIYTI